MVLPTQLDSESSEEEYEEEAEDVTKNMCEDTATKYITKGVTDYDATKSMVVENSESADHTRCKGIVVRSKVLVLCAKMCYL